jgi:probable HAF family extracellular repeat protein
MKSRLLMCFAAITLFAALATPVRLAAQNNPEHNKHHKHHHYKLIDLRTFGGPQSWVFGSFEATAATLNDSGVVVGGADTSASNPNYPNFSPLMGLGFLFNYADPFANHAFKWNEDGLTDLGVLPGGNNSFAQWISSNGLIAGASENGAIDPVSGWPEVHAVLWKENGHVMVDLGTLPGGYESTPLGVNNRGQVVGGATDASSVVGGRAFLWTEDQGLQDLGTLGACCALASYINERGQIAGTSALCDTCNQDVFFWEHGNMQRIPDFGGPISNASALNNRGQIVGQSDLPGGAYAHPFLWDKKKGLKDLGLLSGGSVQMRTGLTMLERSSAYLASKMISSSMQFSGNTELLISGPWTATYAVWRRASIQRVRSSAERSIATPPHSCTRSCGRTVAPWST